MAKKKKKKIEKEEGKEGERKREKRRKNGWQNLLTEGNGKWKKKEE